ncbi:MAG: ribosome maturation factor [Acidobacteria bacterium]|nr:MAG: ribosome maturation factor [Acidobacteriota bacterium]PYX99222.1 MAG: ribosome maturation factor [Acidobacteriota bacterium]PYY22966.1 MAG: ribosome maturation factor [Acidobacteriota bacterium]
MPFDEAHVRAIAERIAASSGLEVVDLEFHGGGKGRVLRIYIEKNAEGRRALELQLAAASQAAEKTSAPENWDRLAGVTHEDCANYSRELGTVLDVEDVIPGGQYLLEVSSPGLDRKLVKPADFQRFSGSKVKIMTREPVAGNRHFEGRLRTLDESRIALEIESGKKKGKKKFDTEGDGAWPAVELEMTNIERARLVPEI